MPPSTPLDSAFEHGRRGQIRKYLQRFTTTIRRRSKDAVVDDSIPQSSAETPKVQEHSHDDTLFTNTIDAEEPTTANDVLEEQSRPTPPVTAETFHIDRASVYQERTQRLRDRFGVNIAGGDRSSFPATARRVQKPARMRLHRSCHECGIDFGHGIHCRACHHRLCADCPRTAGKGIEEAMAQARDYPFHVISQECSMDLDLPMVEAPADVSDQFNNFTSMSSPGKQTSRPSTSLDPIKVDDSFLQSLEADDHVPEPSPIRISHSYRHGKDRKIGSISPRSSRHIPHSISAIRDPILKAPAGVQRVYRKPRQRVRYTCHECSTPFTSHNRTCGKCAHERCHNCRDQSSQKSHKSQADPRLIQAVNQRLAEVGR